VGALLRRLRVRLVWPGLCTVQPIDGGECPVFPRCVPPAGSTIP